MGQAPSISSVVYDIQKDVKALAVDSATIKGEIAAITERLDTTEQNVLDKHNQNRSDIHKLYNGQQQMIDSIHKINLKFAKMAGWAAGAGAVVALIAKIIDKLWK